MKPIGEQSVQLAEGLIKAMSAANRTLRLYPESSPLPLQAVKNFHGLVAGALADKPFLTIGIKRDGFSFQGEPFGGENESLRAFATDLYARQISSLTIRPSVNEHEILEFLKLVSLDAMLVREQGGMAHLLLEQQVSGLMVEEIELRQVEEALDEVTGTAMQIAVGLVDDVSRSTVDAVEQFFVSLSSSVPEMVNWLRSVSLPSADGQGAADVLSEAVRQLAASISATTELPQDQALYMRNIAEGIMALDERLRLEVVAGKMLPGAAASQVFAKVLGQFSERELAEILSGSTEQGLGRTQDLVASLSVLGERQEAVFSLLEQMLLERGHSHGEVDGLKAALESSPRAQEAQAMAEEVVEILRAVSEYSDTDIQKIEAADRSSSEERTSLSALRIRLQLLGEAQNEEAYVRLLDGLGPLLAVLVAQGNVAPAADALDWATAHARSMLKMWPGVTDHLRALSEAAGAQDVVEGLVAHLRVAAADREVHAVARYLSVLPDSSIEVLVDALAEERAMAVRKRLCAVLSGSGRKAVHVLGNRLSDERWYLVRNVVSVFGMIRDRAALPYLKHTSMHPDARVRAETVRSLGILRDPAGTPLLVLALEDQERAVRLAAARWLGRMQAVEATPALARMLEGRVATDLELAKVVIQALSQIGDEGAVPVLRRVASKRSLFGRRRTRELRQVAREALTAMEEAGVGGER